VTAVTPLKSGAYILDVMLFLAAFSQLVRPSEPEPNDLLARSRATLGHVSLTIIALVFVLTTFWKG
jgi:hypothetical protein